jgi:hypothetical protein
MNWNQRYASEDNINLNIDADFTPDESFKNTSDRTKILKEIYRMRELQPATECSDCKKPIKGKQVHPIDAWPGHEFSVCKDCLSEYTGVPYETD